MNISSLKKCKFYDSSIDVSFLSLYLISRCYNRTAAVCGLPQNCVISGDNVTLIYEGGRPQLLPDTPDTLNLVIELSKHDFKTPPSFMRMAQNFGQAMVAWQSTGYATVSEDVYNQRKDTCLKCPFWSDAARMGLGRCSHPGCGCSKLKRHLASGTCPMNLWEV